MSVKFCCLTAWIKGALFCSFAVLELIKVHKQVFLDMLVSSLSAQWGRTKLDYCWILEQGSPRLRSNQREFL